MISNNYIHYLRMKRRSDESFVTQNWNHDNLHQYWRGYSNRKKTSQLFQEVNIKCSQIILKKTFACKVSAYYLNSNIFRPILTFKKWKDLSISFRLLWLWLRQCFQTLSFHNAINGRNCNLSQHKWTRSIFIFFVQNHICLE